MYIRVKKRDNKYILQYLSSKHIIAHEEAYDTSQSAIHARDKAFIKSLFRAEGTLNVIKGVA